MTKANADKKQSSAKRSVAEIDTTSAAASSSSSTSRSTVKRSRLATNDEVTPTDVTPTNVDAPPTPVDKVATIARIDLATEQAPRKYGDDGADFHYYVYMEDDKNKFYEIQVKGRGAFTRYGKVGTVGNAVAAGQLASSYGAMGLLRTKVQEKLRKGYVEIINHPAAAAAAAAAVVGVGVEDLLDFPLVRDCWG
jgi:predicted DNA-binding WGR domain protein